eukprot:s3212_g10.t1
MFPPEQKEEAGDDVIEPTEEVDEPPEDDVEVVDDDEEEEEAAKQDHMYEQPIFMSEVGDRDEYVEYCIVSELTALRHQVGRQPEHFHDFGMRCDDAGLVKLDDFLGYEHMWRNRIYRNSHRIYRWWNGHDERWEVDPDEAQYRMQMLMKIMHHCVVSGKRVRTQILAFGVANQVNRAPRHCREHNITDELDISEDGLIVEPTAVRAPSGHSRPARHEVKLDQELLSHALTAGAVAALPACFHETSGESLMSIWGRGLIPGAGAEEGRLCTFFNRFPPWTSAPIHW